ncbi:hypothetical protein IC229_26760 [Spirosoma sp. BT702]|uniref:Lipoprotein n=1 Tax=Spirosoma profusum TaxID=2771354 RepID=A0A926Y0D9_9BACT|nr:hypothetical protein [Spirosoma profusum]MBD2704274.1 hypothetical protein [Spirosoma profusum]
MKLRFLICLLLIGFTSCSDSSEQLTSLYQAQSADLERIANQLINEKHVRGLTLGNPCEMINGWRRCQPSAPWENWDIQKKRKVYQPSLSAVLAHEKISLATYAGYSNFLKMNSLTSIDRAAECDECVTFEKDLHGLFYTRTTTFQLRQDHEYLSVKKLDAHWYVYTRDWN